MITGHEFIRLSDRWSVLAPPNGDEAVWRTAIGRAYYGAFHLAQDFLANLQITLTKAKDQRSVHKFVQMALNNSGHTDIIKAGSLLTGLSDYRKNADYDLIQSRHGARQLAQHCHCMAGDVRDLITRCEATHHIAIKASIQNWRMIAKM